MYTQALKQFNLHTHTHIHVLVLITKFNLKVDMKNYAIYKDTNDDDNSLGKSKCIHGWQSQVENEHHS